MQKRLYLCCQQFILSGNSDSVFTSAYEAVSNVALTLIYHAIALTPCSLKKLDSILNSAVLLMSYDTLLFSKVKYFMTFSEARVLSYICFSLLHRVAYNDACDLFYARKAC